VTVQMWHLVIIEPTHLLMELFWMGTVHPQRASTIQSQLDLELLVKLVASVSVVFKLFVLLAHAAKMKWPQLMSLQVKMSAMQATTVLEALTGEDQPVFRTTLVISAQHPTSV
jgi:hypothetical protein